MTDPYDLDLPSDWTASRDEHGVTYRGPDGDYRVAVVAVVQGIRLSFRVERHTPAASPEDETFLRDESAAASRARELILDAASADDGGE